MQEVLYAKLGLQNIVMKNLLNFIEFNSLYNKLLL